MIFLNQRTYKYLRLGSKLKVNMQESDNKFEDKSLKSSSTARILKSFIINIFRIT
jgi:hypothetical protein